MENSLNKLTQALPQRKMNIKSPGGSGSALILILSFCLVSLVLAYVSISEGIQTQADKKFAQSAVEVDYPIHGACRNRMRVLTSCKVEILTPSGLKKQNFSFIDFKNKEYQTGVLANPNTPSEAMLTLASEKYWNRISFSVVLFLAALFVMLMAKVTFTSSQRLKKQIAVFQRQSDWQVAALPCTYENEEIAYTAGGEKIEVAFKKVRPIFINQNEEQSVALALHTKEGDTDYFLPFDNEFKLVDFNRAEKEQFSAAVREEFPGAL